jgi:hypothetical protein
MTATLARGSERPVVDRYVDRLAVVHDIRGPRIRLAVLWSVVVLAGFVVGTTGLALVFATTAAIGALQVGARWHHEGQPVNQVLAAAGAALVTLSATINNTVTGLVVLAFAVATMFFPDDFRTVAIDLRSKADEDDAAESDRPSLRTVDRGTVAAIMSRTAHTLGPGLAMGLVGAAVVQVDRVDGMAFLFLFSAVSTFDAGDFLCGAGYQSRFVGPLAGVVGVLMVTVAMYLAQPPPFSEAQILIAGLLLAISCPLGQWVGSWLLPSARSRAPGLRRLDGWLVAAPVFAVVVWFVDG